MVGAVMAVAPRDDGPHDGCGVAEAVTVRVSDGETLAHAHRFLRIAALGLHVDGESLLLQRFGRVEISEAALDAGDVPEQLGDLRTCLPASGALDRERLVVDRGGFVEAALFIEDIGEPGQRLRQFDAPGSIQAPPAIDVGAQERRRAVVLAQLLINCGD